VLVRVLREDGSQHGNLGGVLAGDAELLPLVGDVIRLARRGVDVTDVQDFAWGSFVFFSDPDGNGWAVQQIQPRG